jgi:hypothetical protein
MLTHGEHVKVSAENVSNWTAQLHPIDRDRRDPSNPDREALIRQAVAMANQIRTAWM